MINNLVTSKKADDILKTIRTKYNLRPNIICRYAIVLSLKEKNDPPKVEDRTGREFKRVTLLGEDDLLLRELIRSKKGEHISDDEFMNRHLKDHLERGLELLQNNIQQAKSFDNYLLNLARNGDAI